MNSSPQSLGRNAACPCGSGRRFKACCGKGALPRASTPGTAVADVLQRALALQQCGRWAEAEELYREVLRCNPDLADAVHMLGVIHLQSANYAEALRRLHRAAELFEWKFRAVRHNLGLAIAALVAEDSAAQAQQLWEAYDEWLGQLTWRRRDDRPLVSVVLAAFDSAERIEATLESVFRQSYEAIELIVVGERSRAELRPWLVRSPYRWLVCTGRDGAAAAINEGVSRSRGEFVNLLVGSDSFASTRIETMLDAIARPGASWGFSRGRFAGSDAVQAAHDVGSPAAELTYMADGIAASDTVAMSFLSGNPARSTSALFFARSLFDELGGFREDLCRDWDFCLRASLLAEPVYVPSAEYELGAPISAGLRRAEGDDRAAEATLAIFYETALAARSPPNRFAPVPAIWGGRFFAQLLASGNASALPAAVLRDMARRVTARMPTEGNSWTQP